MDSIVAQPTRRRRARVRRPRQFEQSDAVCETLLIAVVVGSVLAIGTVHRPVLLAIAALALPGGLLAARAIRRMPAVAIILAAFGAFSLLQAVPLPAAWVSRLSPVTAQVWLHCLDPFRAPALERIPVSVDAGASIAEGLKWLTYAAVYVMAVRLRARRGSGFLATLLLASAALVALITLLHGAAASNLVFGIYKPSFAVGRWNVGPLLNSNNFAGYANLGLFAGIGILLSGRPALPRVPVLLALAAVVMALLVSTSRAGLASAGVGGAVIVLWSVKKVGPQWARRLAPPLALLAAGCALLLSYGLLRNWRALGLADVERKVAVWRWAVPMLRDHAWVGVGRGAFETAFPPYRQPLTTDWTATFTHAENFVVQWLSEWGLPVGTAAVILIAGGVLRNWYKARRDPLHFSLMTGLAMLFLQNLADLGLEIPSLAIAAVLAFAAAEPAAPKSTREASPSLPKSIALALPVLAVWALAAVWSRSPVDVERRELSATYRTLAVTNQADRTSFLTELRAAMLRHPGEGYFPLLGSLVAYRGRDGNPYAWIGRTLELDPNNGRAHLLLAGLLQAQHSVSQAMLHLRRAAEYDGTLKERAGLFAARWAPSPEILLEAVPPGKAGNFVLLTACSTLVPNEKRISCLRTAVGRDPSDTNFHTQLAEALLAALTQSEAPCTGDRAIACEQEAESSTRAIVKLEPGSWQASFISARLLLLRRQFVPAAELLARTCPVGAEGRECLRQSVIAALGSGSSELLSAATDTYAARGCNGAASCAQALDWLGQTLQAAGKLAAAISFYTKAAETDGTANRWLRIAGCAIEGRLYTVARAALDRADHSPDASPQTQAVAARLRAQLLVSLKP